MYSFEELVKRVRKDDKLPNYLLALDPGETTGFAIFNKLSLVREGQIRTIEGDIIFWDEIERLIVNSEFSIDCIVCENYRIYQHKLARHSYSPVMTLRLIGGIDYLARKLHISIYYQMATQAKGFVTDEKLKQWGFWLPNKRHSRDAIRHACYFLLFHNRRGVNTGNK